MLTMVLALYLQDILVKMLSLDLLTLKLIMKILILKTLMVLLELSHFGTKPSQEHQLFMVMELIGTAQK